jgi:hypothetical protein
MFSRGALLPRCHISAAKHLRARSLPREDCERRAEREAIVSGRLRLREFSSFCSSALTAGIA